MSEAVHTQGEWEVNPDFEPGENITIESQGAPIAVVYGTDSFPCLDEDDHDFDALHAENLATACAMAAAPDMLAALDAIGAIAFDLGRVAEVAGVTGEKVKQMAEALRMARGARLKARGEQ